MNCGIFIAQKNLSNKKNTLLHNYLDEYLRHMLNEEATRVNTMCFSKTDGDRSQNSVTG